MEEITIKIYFGFRQEELLKATNWTIETPVIDPSYKKEVDDLIITGILMRCDNGSIRLTDIGEDVLSKINE